MNYKTYKIAELIDEIAMGPFGSNIKVECFVNKGVPVLNGSNLNGFALSEKEFRYVTPEKADSLKKAIAVRGDVVITHRGTLGQIVYIPKTSKYGQYVISQSQFRIRCNSKILPEYMVYYFHTDIGQHKLLSNTSQVGVPALARPSSTFQQIEIEVPSIDVQCKVVAILEEIQKKISCNNKINDNLEQQAAALIARYQAVTDTSIELSAIMDFENGFAFQSSTYLAKGAYRIITIKNVQDGRIDSDGAAYIDSIPPRMKNGCKLRIGDALLSLTGNVGRVGIVCENNLLMNQRVAKIVPHDPELLPFLYFVFRLPNTKTMLESIAKGTAQLNLSPVETLKLTIPFDKETALQLSRDLDPIFRAIAVNNQESISLATARDTLLPRLMCGEIAVD